MSHSEPLLPMEAVCSPVFVETSLLLIENIVIILSWAIALQGDAHFPQDSQQQPLISSKIITKIRS